jgi:hypothetical protein
VADIRIRYVDKPETVLPVRLLHTWHRGDIPAVKMSNSSGAKETMNNTIYTMFDRDGAIDAISMVRASGPPILIIRKGETYYDVASGRPGEPPHTGKEVQVQHKNIRRADKQEVRHEPHQTAIA